MSSNVISSRRSRLAEHLPVGFFLMRTPLLPYEALERVFGTLTGRHGPRVDEDELKAIASSSAVREALLVGASGFAEVVDAWLRGEREDPDGKIRTSLLNYLCRICWRPTPFGYFAGTTLGVVDRHTRLQLAGREQYTKQVLLDFGVMAATGERLSRNAQLTGETRLRANPSVYSLAGQFRFVERHIENTQDVSYGFASVEHNEFAQSLLSAARDERSMSELVALLMADGIEAEDARGFVADMVTADLLQPVCDPPLSSDNHLRAWAQRLAPMAGEAGDVASTLSNIERLIERTNGTVLGNDLDTTRQLLTEARSLSGAANHESVVDARLGKPAVAMTLGTNVVEAVRSGIHALGIAAAKRFPGVYVPEELSAFMARFHDRYGELAVPLCEALDAESGVGYPGAWEMDSEDEPAMAGSFSRNAEWVSQLQRVVWNVTQRGDMEFELGETGWLDAEAVDPPVARALVAYGRIAAANEDAVDRGDFRLFLPNVSGPSAVAFMGRFSVVDRELTQLIKEQIAREHSHQTDAVAAEVLHVGPGRIGNVTLRPRLTEYEIDYMGGSEARGPHRILASDLLVYIDNGRVVLWSKELQREVVPRVSSAYVIYQRRNLPLYRFLNALKAQHTAIDIAWSWGPLEDLPFLPRVVHGRTVLALARWALREPDLAPILRDDGQGRDAFDALLERLNIPPLFLVRGAQMEELLIDSRAPNGFEVFAGLAKRFHELTVYEAFPGPDVLCAHGPEGRFVSEFMLPLAAPAAATIARPARKIVAERPRFAPGSEWLYVKLYAGWATLDRLLLAVVAPLVERHAADISRWFFIRYADPDSHLRLRFRGSPSLLWGRLLPELHQMTAELMGIAAITRISIDTYDPEVVRYGGAAGVDIAERMFEIDSRTVIRNLQGDDNPSDERRRLISGAQTANYLIDALLGQDPPTIARFARGVRDSLIGSEHRAPGMRKHAVRQSSDAYRMARREIEAAMLVSGYDLAGEMALRDLGTAYRDLAEHDALTSPLERVVSAIVHMHCNRWFRLNQRGSEATVYDWVARVQASQAALASTRA